MKSIIRYCGCLAVSIALLLPSLLCTIENRASSRSEEAGIAGSLFSRDDFRRFRNGSDRQTGTGIFHRQSAEQRDDVLHSRPA